MKKCICVCLAVLACGLPALADTITQYAYPNGQSNYNTDIYGQVTYNNGGGSVTNAYGYVSQFIMNYVTGSPGAIIPGATNNSNYLTYCVELNVMEQPGTTYNVTGVQAVSSAFGAQNGAEMTYLYAAYGKSSQKSPPAPTDVMDAALQLDFWALSLKSTYTPTTFTASGSGTAFTVASNTGAGGIGLSAFFMDTNMTEADAIAAEATSLLSSADAYYLNPNSSTYAGLIGTGDGVFVLDNNGQNVLYYGPIPPVPEPAALTLFSIGAAAFIGYTWRRRKMAVA
jgi:hypothetical protein